MTSSPQPPSSSDKSNRAISHTQLLIGLFILLIIIGVSVVLFAKSGVPNMVKPTGETPAGVIPLRPTETEITKVPLTVLRAFPADQSENVETNALITIVFNQAVVPLSSLKDQSNLLNPLVITPTIEGKAEWIATSVFTLQPTKPLHSGESYHILIKKGLKDVSQTNELQADFQWSFTTRPAAVSALRLKSGAVNPPDGQDRILLDEAFTVDFLQPMDEPSTNQAIKLTAEDGSKTPLSTLWSEDATSVVITPTQRLKVDTTYQLVIGQDAKTTDGSALEKGLQWSFHTLPQPSILSITPADNTTQSNYTSEFAIQFSSPMRIDTVKDKITITPKPKETIEWWYNEWDYSIHTYVLKPSTEYQVEIQPGMEDIYGNKITQGVKLHFKTAPYPPQVYLNMPYQAALFRQNKEEQYLYVNLINAKSATLKLYRLNLQDFVDLSSYQKSTNDFTPPANSLVKEITVNNTKPLDIQDIAKVSLSSTDGKALENGYYFIGLDCTEIPHPGSPFLDTRLFIVANANLTLKTTPTEALIWMTDLESGNPLADINVEVMGLHQIKLGKAKTDQNGLARIQYPETYYDNTAFAYTTEGQIFSFAGNNWGSGSSEYDQALWSHYYAVPGQWRAYVYTERPIYRPGQPVYFKAVIRNDDDLKYSLPSSIKTARVVISSYDGKKVWEDTLAISDYGTISGKYNLSEDAALGGYILSVFLPNNENPIGDIVFNVAEYRRPEFKVTATVEPEELLQGAAVNGMVAAEYYSGGNVSNGAVHYTVIASPFTFSPGGDYLDYSFSDEDIDATESGLPNPPASEMVAEGDFKLDTNGKATIKLPSDLGNLKKSRRMEFEADITDVGGNVVSGRAVYVVHQSQLYVGIKPLAYIGESGQEQSFRMVVLDWNAKPQADQNIQVEIVERRWHSVQEQQPDGTILWTSKVEDIPVTTFSDVKTDAKGIAEVKFVPPNGGIFRAKACVKDNSQNEHCSTAYLWVAGGEYVPWLVSNDHSFRLVSDKKEYQPGDVAELLIASPYQGSAYGLVTVERGHIRQSEVIPITSNSMIYRLPIQDDMAPNIYISVVIVKGVDKTNPRPSFKIGLAEINVSTQKTKLNVTLEAQPKPAKPGDTVTINVMVKDSAGNPVQADVSLGISDLATLSLVDPNSPPIYDYFYNRRSLGVQTSTPLLFSMDDYNALTQAALVSGAGMGSGGGKGGGELGVVTVRREFPDTAFWQADLLTNQDGKATVSVKLPDNLTTWRLDARAVTKDTYAGQATLDLLTTKPLMVEPMTPRFFVAGDQVSLGSVIHNNTAQALDVQVEVQAKGIDIQDEKVKKVNVAAGQQAYVSWNGKVPLDSERVDLIFSAKSGDLSDASKPTLATLADQGIMVLHYTSPETVATAGSLKQKGTREEQVVLPQNYNTPGGTLTIRMEPSLAAGMLDGLSYLENYPYDCIEQTVSRFLPNILTLQAFHKAGITDAEKQAKLDGLVQTSLQRIYNRQNPDGGWGWWNSDKSDIQTSAYVLLSLTEAKKAGYAIDQDVYDHGIDFLKNNLIDPGTIHESYLFNQQAFVMYVLDRANVSNSAMLGKLYDYREQLAIYAKAYLAHALHQANPSDTRVQTLLSDLQNKAVSSATGVSWHEKTTDYYSWNTDTRTTAIVLAMLNDIDPTNPLNENIVRWLMHSRNDGHWGSTQEGAWALMALSGWLEKSGELQSNYNYQLTLNNKNLGNWQSDPKTITQQTEVKIAVSDLLKNAANQIIFSKDNDSGTLYYTVHLSLPMPVDEVEPLDRGVIVTRQYFKADNPQASISEAHQGDVVYVRVTVVVPNDAHYLVVEDALPAGLEAIDQSLLTSSQSEQPQQFNWQEMQIKGWGWWNFTHVEYRDEKVVLSAEYLPAGTYSYTYLARASTVGDFQTIPTLAYEFYFPEVFGRGAGMVFRVLP